MKFSEKLNRTKHALMIGQGPISILGIIGAIDQAVVNNDPNNEAPGAITKYFHQHCLANLEDMSIVGQGPDNLCGLFYNTLVIFYLEHGQQKYDLLSYIFLRELFTNICEGDSKDRDDFQEYLDAVNAHYHDLFKNHYMIECVNEYINLDVMQDR